MKTSAAGKISGRIWAVLILVGLSGQFAWTLENMYFNVFLYNTISTDPGYIAAMVAASAVAATVTTLLMGALSDRVGNRRAFISVGYILWGLSTAAFGFITKESAGKLFPAASAAAAAATLVVVMDLEGDFSELLQHEYDHLDGILAVMRAIDNKSYFFKEALA